MEGTLVQYAGRLHRLHPGKTEVRIYDYVDRQVPLFVRMFEKRLRGYRAIGYARDDGLLGDGAGPDESPVADRAAEPPTKSLTRKTHGPRRGRQAKQALSPTTVPW
jgi:superfamily II DNA or RNA helicase